MNDDNTWVKSALSQFNIDYNSLPSVYENESSPISQFIIDGEKRTGYREQYTYAIPTKRAIESITEYSPLIEMGAGSGYWASLIEKAGGNILPFDATPPQGKVGNQYKITGLHTNVRRGWPSTVKKYPNRTLFLCWPPYDTSMAFDSLKYYSGNYLIFIGEGNGGCTADDKFFDELNANWDTVEEISIPQWMGLHDYLNIYKRKKDED